MRQVFISYARDDRQRVEALAARLRRLVDSVWFDSQLHGGEDWWAGILERIRSCDLFLAVVSSASLGSEACRIERQYAASVNRTIVPVALEALPPALPSDIATLQIVDFSTPGEQSLSDLARALLAAPDPAPLPDPLPEDPPAPLSYLTDLVDLVNSPRELTKSEQMDILLRLERGLGSADHDEREGARQVLLSMKQRDDLATSVEKTIDLLARDQVPVVEPVPPEDRGHEPTAEPAPGSPTTPGRPPEASTLTAEATRPTDTEPSVGASREQDRGRHRRVIIAVVAVALVALAGITWTLIAGGEDDTGDLVTVPAQTADAPDPSDNGTPPSTPTPPPGVCANPPSIFPGEVPWGDANVSDTALAWQRLLVSLGEFNNHPDNCDGSYDGTKQRDRVIEVRTFLGLPAADGLLDEALYNCLVLNECPGPGPCTEREVPNVVGLQESEAVTVLRQEGFGAEPRDEPTGADAPGTVLRQDPPAGTSQCEGTVVEIEVAVGPPTPTSTAG